MLSLKRMKHIIHKSRQSFFFFLFWLLIMCTALQNLELSVRWSQSSYHGNKGQRLLKRNAECLVTAAVVGDIKLFFSQWSDVRPELEFITVLFLFVNYRQLFSALTCKCCDSLLRFKWDKTNAGNEMTHHSLRSVYTKNMVFIRIQTVYIQRQK